MWADNPEPDRSAEPPPTLAEANPSHVGEQVHPGVLEVTAGLVFRQGKILITQRFPDSHLGGLWEFPGGKREPGESLAGCLARELEEELGIEVDVGEEIDSILHVYPERTVHLHFFRCRWRAREPQALGCPAFHWVSRDELLQHEFPAADARLLGTLIRRADLWADSG